MLNVLVCEPADYFLHAFAEKIAAHPEYKVELASEIVSLDPFIIRGPDVLLARPVCPQPEHNGEEARCAPRCCFGRRNVSRRYRRRQDRRQARL